MKKSFWLNFFVIKFNELLHNFCGTTRLDLLYKAKVRGSGKGIMFQFKMLMTAYLFDRSKWGRKWCIHNARKLCWLMQIGDYVPHWNNRPLALNESERESVKGKANIRVFPQFKLIFDKLVMHANSWNLWLFEAKVEQKARWPIWENIRLVFLGSWFNPYQSFS